MESKRLLSVFLGYRKRNGISESRGPKDDLRRRTRSALDRTAEGRQ